jgi:hypothetical protein
MLGGGPRQSTTYRETFLTGDNPELLLSVSNIQKCGTFPPLIEQHRQGSISLREHCPGCNHLYCVESVEHIFR